MKNIKEIFKKYSKDSGSFIYVIGFAMISNLIQVVCFYFLKDLNVQAFALINFGVYVFTLMGIITTAFSKWLTIELSKTEPNKRFKLSVEILRKTVIPFLVTIIGMAVILILGTPDVWLIILLCTVAGIFALFFQFVNSWVNAREWFGLFGFLTIIAPLFRLFSIVFFVNDNNVWISFLAVAIGTFVSIFVAIAYIYKRDHKFINSTVNVPIKINLKLITFNTLLQIAINVFWIADGVILKTLFTEEVYSTYVAYAYIYKFPLFVCLNIIAVVLGKNLFKKEQRAAFTRTFLLAMSLIILSFGALLGIEIFREGLILEVLGYQRFVIPGLTYYFGGAWMIQMVLFFLFSYRLKIKKSRGLSALIVTYALSYVAILYLFSNDIFILMKAILLQGFIFTVFVIIFRKKV